MSNSTIYPYVNDQILIDEIKNILNVFNQAQSKLNKTFQKNTIDPFSAFIEAACNNITYAEWVKLEKRRQLQKTLQNTIGYFHQRILGGIDGWHDPGTNGGYDSENLQKKIFAEIKNKYNTLNSSSAAATYDKMTQFLKTTKKGHTGYVVIIIPKSNERYNKPFAPPGKPFRDDLFEVDGATYYSMCTGDKNALKMLYQALPKALSKATAGSQSELKPEVEKFMDFFTKAYG